MALGLLDNFHHVGDLSELTLGGSVVGLSGYIADVTQTETLASSDLVVEAVCKATNELDGDGVHLLGSLLGVQLSTSFSHLGFPVNLDLAWLWLGK